MATTFWARTDTKSAGDPTIKLSGDPALEITFVASGANGDWTLEQPSGGGIDPDTQVEIGGVLYDVTFELTGNMPTTHRNGAAQVPNQCQGETLCAITVHDYPTAGDTTRLVFMPDGHASQAEMDAFGSGPIAAQNANTAPDPAPICFAAGTKLRTETGPCAVEDLCVGDFLMTESGKPTRIIWIGFSSFCWPESDEKFRPILFPNSGMGPGYLNSHLIVSPQHKLLVTGPGIGRGGVLAPAKGLIGLPGVRVMKGKKQVTYFHVLTERHTILSSEGIFSESFYPGPTALDMIGAKNKIGLMAALPQIFDGLPESYGPHARECLTVMQTRRLVAAGKIRAVVRDHNNLASVAAY